MSTNYYITDRQKFNLEQEKYKKFKDIDFEHLGEKLNDDILFSFDSFLKFLERNNQKDLVNNFKSEELVNIDNFIFNLRYNTSYETLFNSGEYIHIGKKSMGWLFLFKLQPYWSNFEELKDYLLKLDLSKKMIVDEYGREISPQEFLEYVEKSQNDKNDLQNKDNFLYSKNIDGYRFTENEFS